jgi:hypothetical protein
MVQRLSNGIFQITNVSVDELNYAFQLVRRELDQLRGLQGPIQLHDTIVGLTLAESQITFTDVTTGNVTSIKHGFAPKSPGSAAGLTKFLNGGDTPDYAQVKDSDLTFTDITTNNSSVSKHGFLPKLSGSNTDFLDGTGVFDQVEDADLLLADVTTNNSSTSNHGFLKKLSNVATDFMNGQGAWATPAGGGGSITVTETDGSPSVTATTIKVTNGTLTDNGGGVCTITTGGTGTPRYSGDPTTYSYIKDDFQVGGAASSAIGELKWVNINTTSLVLASEANHPGIYRFSSTVIGGITQKNTQIDQMLFADNFDMYFIHRINGTLANSTNRLGIFLSSTGASNNPPTDGIFFERLTSDSNWFGVVRAGSSQTRTDTTNGASNSAFQRLRIRRIDATTIGFTVDSNSEVTNTATEPTGNAFVVMQMIPATGTQTADIDFFDLLIAVTR